MTLGEMLAEIKLHEVDESLEVIALPPVGEGRSFYIDDLVATKRALILFSMRGVEDDSR